MAAPASEEDVRTLWVDFDEHGERFKTWRKVVQESSFQQYGDCPLEGPATQLALAKHMERHGGDPRRWLQGWQHAKQLETSDRAMHELKVLVDALYFFGTSD